MTVHFENVRDVAVITIDFPPVNSLDRGTRGDLLSAFRQAGAQPAVRAIVLWGGPTVFSAGADINEFAGGLDGGAFAEPALPHLTDTVEASSKPVIAAIGGVCMGGGLELALACHYRVVAADARFALPEVKLGLLPGAGGTQRLPRAIGVVAALDWIVSGATVDAAHAIELGLGEIATGDLKSAAIAKARSVVGAPVPILRQRQPEVPGDQSVDSYFAKLQAKHATSGLAVRRCIDAVCAAVVDPFEEGLRKEASYFKELLQTSDARALQYAFFSDRRAASLEGIDATVKPRTVERVGIVGAGTMGTGIAICALQSGLRVVLVESQATNLERAVSTVERHFNDAVRKGRMSGPAAAAARSQLTPSTTLEGLADADLVIEAVFEDLALKQGVFRQLDQITKSNAVLASNTSTLDVDKIAAVTRRPSDVVGMHFFSPAQHMRLLEVVRGARTDEAVLTTAMRFARRIGKTAVVAGVCDGFIGNRMFEEYLRQAYFLLDEGLMPWDVDAALEAWGMAMGPFAVMDLAGGDIGWAVRKRRRLEQPDRPYSELPDRLCELGRFGQKTGAGWYRYETESRARHPDPLVAQLANENAASLGLSRRSVTAQEVVDRCVLALVNEGAALLQEGIAQRASDIDVVYRNGYGFPSYRGGPMYFADQLTIPMVLERMRHFERGYQGQFWKPTKLLVDLAERDISLTRQTRKTDAG